MSLESRLVAAFNAVGVDVKALQAALNAKLNANAPSVTNAREWTASVVSQAEAEAGTATTARKWTAQRVRQAVNSVANLKAPINSPVFTGLPTVPNMKFGNVASADVNTLDYYEEGAWTPTLRGSTNAGTATYSFQFGAYTKIGNCVFWTARVSLTSFSGAAGQLWLDGFPFISINNASVRSGLHATLFQNLAVGAVSVTGIMRLNTPQADLYINTSIGTSMRTANAGTDLNNDSTLWLSGFYFAI